jgi:hypothetical protein
MRLLPQSPMLNMKHRYLLILCMFNVFPAIAAPDRHHGPGPASVDVPVNQKFISIYDSAPDVIALAQKYQKQLFNSNEGKEILLRSKKLGEYYATNLHVDENGNLDSKNFDTFQRAETGPKKQLEADIDRLLATKWNKPNVLDLPMKTGRSFAFKITSNGESQIIPFRLRNGLD